MTELNVEKIYDRYLYGKYNTRDIKLKLTFILKEIT